MNQSEARGIRIRRSTRRIRCPAAFVAPLVLFASALPAVELDVRVEGLGGRLAGLGHLSIEGSDVRQNVLAALSIRRAAEEEKDVPPGRIRSLHERAPEEIRAALEPFGYYRSTIRPRLDQGDSRWIATYEIDPGPPIPVGDVDIQITGTGSEEPLLSAAVRRFPLESGDPLVHPAYQAGKKAIEDAASDAGYLDARFETAEIRVDLARYQADVVLHMKTGHRFFFGPAVFRQNIVDADLVAGYLNWDRGDPFDMGKVLQFQNALADAPYFERVEVETPRDDAEDFQIPVIATLTPAKRTRYVFGAGYGTDTGFRGTLGAQFRRLNRRGHRAEAELRYSELERGVEGRYLIPGPYPRTDVITFRGAYAEQRTDTSRSDGWLVGAGIAQSRGAWRESFSLNYQQEKFEIGVDRGTSRLLVPEASWTRIQADDRIFATRGWRIEFLGRGAHESVGSDATFLQLEAHGKIIHSLTPRHRLIGRLDLGHIVTHDFRSLPARIRYFAGGDRSVRGYGFHELGRRDREGNVIGGETLAVASIEYEFWFRPKWAAALFFDAGDAARGFPSDWKKAAGVGGRWRSPIGPVRLDVGFGFDDPRHAAVVHLTVGPDL